MRQQLRKALAALTAACFLLGPVQAAEVTIRRGELEVNGVVLGYDGTYLRLGADAGELTLDYRSVTCDGAACPVAEDYVPTVRLSGAHRMADILLPALIDGYARSHDLRTMRREVDDSRFEYDLEDRQTGTPVMRFAFHVTNSDGGFHDLLNNRADLALSVREVRPSEVTAAQQAGLGRLSDPRRSEMVALDALVPIVSPSRKLSVLSPDALAAIFAGKLTDWAELGSLAGPISLHLLDPDSGYTQGFVDRVLGPYEFELANGVRFHDSPDELALAVASDRDGIGITLFGRSGSASIVPLGGHCGLTSLPQRTALKTEDYPLTRPLFFYTVERRLPPLVQDWLEWLRTADAQRVVRRAGFVDRGVVPIPLAQQGDRLVQALRQTGEAVSLAEMQAMIERLNGRYRLSTTFRFDPGSTRLDAQSRSNLLQLARGLRDGDYDRERLFLIGFSDGRGPAEPNQALSLARAESVRRALLAVLDGALPEGVSLEIEAYGEALPTACDDTESGSQSNRRVELWVQP